VLEQRLGAAITQLLAPVGAHRVAPVVPHHRAGVEPERPDLVLEPPAQIHVVAGGSEAGIEPADRRQRRSPERHVAARDVLGLGVGEEHVHRPSR
jgi:hypothetical protein